MVPYGAGIPLHQIKKLNKIGAFTLPSIIFKHIQPIGRYIRRLKSDFNLIYPSRLRPSPYVRLTTHNFHPPYGLKFKVYLSFILFLEVKVLPWATCTRHAGLIHRFLCFTAKVLLVFRRSALDTTR